MAVWRIEPGDVSGPILAVFGVWGRFSVGEIVIVAALVEGIILPTRNPLKKLKVLTKMPSTRAATITISPAENLPQTPNTARIGPETSSGSILRTAKMSKPKLESASSP